MKPNDYAKIHAPKVQRKSLKLCNDFKILRNLYAPQSACHAYRKAHENSCLATLAVPSLVQKPELRTIKCQRAAKIRAQTQQSKSMMKKSNKNGRPCTRFKQQVLEFVYWKPHLSLAAFHGKRTDRVTEATLHCVKRKSECMSGTSLELKMPCPDGESGWRKSRDQGPNEIEPQTQTCYILHRQVLDE